MAKKMTMTQKKRMLESIKSKASKLSPVGSGELDNVLSMADYMAIIKIVEKGYKRLRR